MFKIYCPCSNKWVVHKYNSLIPNRTWPATQSKYGSSICSAFYLSLLTHMTNLHAVELQNDSF